MAKGKATRRKSGKINFLTGDAQLDARLFALAGKASKYLRRGIGKGMDVLVKAQRREAPTGETKAIKKGIGKRFKKNKKTGIVEAKCGMNVGKKKVRPGAKAGKGSQAPHGPLVILGTDDRQTKDGKNRGKVSPNDFIRRATSAASGQAMETIKTEIAKAIAQDAGKHS